MAFLLLSLLLIITLQLCLALLPLTLLIITCFIVLRYQKRKKQSQLVQDEIQTPTADADPIQNNETQITEDKTESNEIAAESIQQLQPQFLDDEETQFLFEQFITAWLEKSRFYQSDSNSQQNGQPVKYSVQSGDDSFQIAIVCRWKPSLIKGRMEWAKSHQLVGYREYQKMYNIPFFVVGGVGGNPDAPALVSVVTLNRVRSNVLSQSQLQAHEVSIERPFTPVQVNEPAAGTHLV